MRGILLSTRFVIVLTVCSAYCQGTIFFYDQQSATNQGRLSSDGGAPFQAGQPMGQSFTPSLSSVDFVQMKFNDFYRSNGVGTTVYVNLRADSISGTVLGSTAPVFMPVNFSYGITNFFFSTSVTVIPGITYYFQPFVQSGDSA